MREESKGNKEEAQARISELGSELNRAASAVQERGQRLSKLEQHMADMADQAKSMTEMVEKYNREQANKRWWQF